MFNLSVMLPAMVLAFFGILSVSAAEPVTVAGGGVAVKEPRLEFMFESKVKIGEVKLTGLYNGQQRGTAQLVGGTFAGPQIRGTILPSTHDWPVYFGNGVRLTDVAYNYVTDDGAQLFITVNGYRYDPTAMKGQLSDSENVTPAGNLLRVFMRIEAPDDSKYAWMNYNLFIGVAGSSGADRTATLRVYRVL